jgi:hypothetical protein
MRTTLLALSAFLLLAYPLVLLLAVVINLDRAQKKPQPAAITLTARSSSEWLNPDAAQRSPGLLRNASIRKSR